MIGQFGIGVFPPVYDVEMIGKEIEKALNETQHMYRKTFRESKLFGTIVEFIPSNYLNSESITVVGCLNPNKITNITTKKCTMVLFKTPNDLKNVSSLMTRLQGSFFTLESYISLLEKSYKTSLMLEQDFNKTDVCNWLELINKKSLMALRGTSLGLWEYTIESSQNPLTESTDYMIEFVKTLKVDNEVYRANIGWYITEDEDGQCIERLHTLASDTEIEKSEGRCLRVNYNRKRFLKELSLLTMVTKEELLMLDSFGDTLIKNSLTAPEIVPQVLNIFSIVQ